MLLPCGSASMSSRLQVVGAVPTGAKILSRRWSNIWVCVGVSAAGVDGGEEAGLGAVAARCGWLRGAAGAGACRTGADGGDGAVTVTCGTGVVPGGAGVAGCSPLGAGVSGGAAWGGAGGVTGPASGCV